MLSKTQVLYILPRYYLQQKDLFHPLALLMLARELQQLQQSHDKPRWQCPARKPGAMFSQLRVSQLISKTTIPRNSQQISNQVSDRILTYALAHTNYLRVNKDHQSWLSSIPNSCPGPGNVSGYPPPQYMAMWKINAIRKEVGEWLLQENQNCFTGKVSKPSP